VYRFDYFFAYTNGMYQVKRGEPALGVPLAEYVHQNIVNPMTDNLHEVVYQTSSLLSSTSISTPPSIPSSIASQVDRSLKSYPMLTDLLRISNSQIDMASLIKRPDEIYESENEWVGREYVANAANAAGGDDVMNGEKKANAAVGLNGKIEFDSPEVLKHVLDYTAETIDVLNQRIRDLGDVKMKQEGDEEDPVVRKLRLNLLALTKRAPLDKIALLPKELVPVHIRHFVPTIAS
jgi:bromodomain-containing protein 7/9